MLIVSKQDELDILNAVASEAGFLTTLARFNGESLDLEPWAVAFLLDPSRFRCLEKARQIGGSFTFACEAFARSHLRDGHNSVIVSYNLDDAKEKILYVDQLHEELPLAYQKRRITDSKTEIAFASNRPGGRASRIISNPSRAPRGKHGDIYLDELSHYTEDRAVYKGATALILRVKGAQLTIASTPLGRRGVFWEIATEEVRKYTAYSRQRIPWWLCRFFCVDVHKAAAEASTMPTEERVAQFGTQDIKDQLGSLELDDFQQEFEVFYVDESMSYYPYELILPCTSASLKVATDPEKIKKPKGRLTAGFDVGRRRDLSELVVVEELGRRKVVRLMSSFYGMAFTAQEAELRRLLDRLPIARLWIDETGIGMNLAENLALDYPEVVVPVSFTNAKKEIWATDFKILMQKRDVLMPRDRILIAQIHSIRRKFTAMGSVQFDSERTQLVKGYVDKFWALALACQRERGAMASRGYEVGVRIVEA